MDTQVMLTALGVGLVVAVPLVVYLHRLGKCLAVLQRRADEGEAEHAHIRKELDSQRTESRRGFGDITRGIADLRERLARVEGRPGSRDRTSP